MKILPFIAVLAFSLATNTAIAHGPVRQEQDKTIIINAPAEKVWGLIKNFGDIANWHSEVSTSPVTDGNETGAIRVLTLKNGAEITEELKKYDAQGMAYSYKINNISFSKKMVFAGNELEIPDFPVKSFIATLSLTPNGNTSTVHWEAKFLRAYTGNIDPKTNEPKEMNDEVANEAVKQFLDTGLIELKKLAEQ